MPLQGTRSEVLIDVIPGVRSALKMSQGGPEINLDVQVDGRVIPEFASLSVLPATLSIAEGEVGYVRAYGVDAAGKSTEITDMCRWTTASAVVCTVTRRGHVVGVGAGGPTNITATYKHDVSHDDTCAVTVTS